MTAMTIRKMLPLVLLGAAAAQADERVVREYTFDLDGIGEIELRGSVGSMDIEEIEGTEARLVLEITSKDHGWFDRARDVSGIELHSRVRGDRLVLAQEEDETETEWTIQLPAVARTTIRLGVGDIDARLGATELSVDLGVGDVDVELPLASTGRVDIDVGVGDASLRGTDAVERDRTFVSQDVSGRGAGDKDADVHAGVGDVTVSLVELTALVE